MGVAGNKIIFPGACRISDYHSLSKFLYEGLDFMVKYSKKVRENWYFRKCCGAVSNQIFWVLFRRIGDFGVTHYKIIVSPTKVGRVSVPSNTASRRGVSQDLARSSDQFAMF